MTLYLRLVPILLLFSLIPGAQAEPLCASGNSVVYWSIIIVLLVVLLVYISALIQEHQLMGFVLVGILIILGGAMFPTVFDGITTIGTTYCGR